MHAQTPPPALPTSTCVAGVTKTVDPGQMRMVDTAQGHDGHHQYLSR